MHGVQTVFQRWDRIKYEQIETLESFAKRERPNRERCELSALGGGRGFQMQGHRGPWLNVMSECVCARGSRGFGSSLAMTLPTLPRAVQCPRVNTESDHPNTIEAFRIFRVSVSDRCRGSGAGVQILTGITLDSGPDSLQERYYPKSRECSD